MKLITASFLLLTAQLVFLKVVEAQFKQEVDEIAPYTVIKEAQGYEERAYPSSPWVCHSSTLQDHAMNADSYWPLFGYMSGLNSNGVVIPMTKPVTVEMKEDAQAGVWNSNMCFYLPEAHQQSPPVPVSEDVHLENRPAMKVFARRAGGNLTSEQWTTLADELRAILESAEPAADLSSHYLAGYDSPSKATNRRNEVWFRKT